MLIPNFKIKFLRIRKFDRAWKTGLNICSIPKCIEFNSESKTKFIFFGFGSRSRGPDPRPKSKTQRDPSQNVWPQGRLLTRTLCCRSGRPKWGSPIWSAGFRSAGPCCFPSLSGSCSGWRKGTWNARAGYITLQATVSTSALASATTSGALVEIGTWRELVRVVALPDICIQKAQMFRSGLGIL